MTQQIRSFWMLVIGSVASVGLAIGIVVAPLSGTDARQSPATGSVGSWRVTIATEGRHLSPNLATLSSDGVILVSNPTIGPAVDGLPAELMVQTPGFGSWISTGERHAAVTFEVLVADIDGHFLGPRTSRADLELDPSGDAWSGEFVVTYADPAGEVIQTVSGTVTATRITVEPMALDTIGTPPA